MTPAARWIALGVLLAGAGGGVGAAWAQPAPSGKPSAGAAASARPVASAKPADKQADKAKPGEKPDAKSGPASSASALPAGHPPVDAKLPAGHPRVEEDDDPHGRDGSGMFKPPPDGATDDPALPLGTIVAEIKDAQDKPVPRAPVTLGILHNSVAKGESSERRQAQADDAGTVRFDGLEIGTGVSYVVSTSRGPANFATPAFNLTDKAGKRASLHAYPSVTRAEELRLGVWGVVYIELRDDVLQIEQQFTLLNVDPVAWVPDGFIVGLPPEFKAFTKPEEAGSVRFDELKDEGATLRGTLTPGQHEASFRYQVPLKGDERQTVKIRLPPRTFQIGVMAEAGQSMGLVVAGFPAAQRQDRAGKRLLLTRKQASSPSDPMRTVEITLTGLPVPGPGRWIAVALGLGVVGLAAYYLAAKKEEDGTLDPDARRDLVDAKNALLDEIVALERAHKDGDVGPKAYARIRAALTDALARVVTTLEESSRRAREKGAGSRRARQAT